MPTRHIELTDDLDRFVAAAVESGRFGDASEAVREGLRLLEERDAEDRAKLEWLREAAKKGFDAIDRGESTTLRSPAEVTAFVRQLALKSLDRNVEAAL